MNDYASVGNLIRSDTPESIYYADLFRINDRNWMIQGYGKTKAALVSCGRQAEAMYATDAVAIIRKGETLWGRYDPGALNNSNPELSKLHKLDAIAYCLNEEQTIQAFKPRDGKREIVDVDAEMLSALCATYPYPAYFAPQFFTSAEIAYFAEPLRMTNRFRELTKGILTTKFLIVPHMPTVEEKGHLYTSYDF